MRKGSSDGSSEFRPNRGSAEANRIGAFISVWSQLTKSHILSQDGTLQITADQIDVGAPFAGPYLTRGSTAAVTMGVVQCADLVRNDNALFVPQ